jgi:hypothetical protein
MSLDKVLALARSYSREERGHLERVRAYESREPARPADAYQHYEIIGHAVDLRDTLDPAILDQLLHHSGDVTYDEAEDIIHQLMDYKKQIGWKQEKPPLSPTPHPVRPRRAA